MAPRQAEFEVLGGSKEGAKFVVGDFGNFPMCANKGDGDIMKTRPSANSGPEPGMTVSVVVTEAGKQNISPHPGSKSGVTMLCDVDGVVHVW